MVDQLTGALTDQVALVTGAGSGIGREIAHRLARAGADLLLLDLAADGLAGTADLVQAAGRRALALPADVTDEDQVVGAVTGGAAQFGRLDILVNNAGRSLHSAPEDLSLADWHRIMDINATGYFLCAREVGRVLIAQGRGGSIVNLSSIGGSTSLGRGSFVYGVAKAAINQMTRELAVEWARHRIRVNAVQPCQVRTPALARLLADDRFPGLEDQFLRGIPLGRLAEPGDVADVVVFLCGAAAAMVTGVCLPVDGGNLAVNAGGTVVHP